MASTDVTCIPAQGQINRFGIWFVNTMTNTIVTGWTGGATLISLDGGAMAAGPGLVEVSVSGVGYFELSAAQMNAQLILGIASITNVNARSEPFEIRPMQLKERLGRPQDQTVQRLEDYLVKAVMYLLDPNQTVAGVQTTFNAAGTPDLTAALQQLATGVIRNRMDPVL